jgi:hypothetical protein
MSTRKHRKGLRLLLIALAGGLLGSLGTLAAGCTSGPPPPPPLRLELSRPVRPHPEAVWVNGRWQWKGKIRGYVWVPGHWRARP